VLYRERNVVYRVLVGNPEGKTLLKKPRRKFEDNNKIDLQDVGCVIMVQIDMAQF